MSALDLLTDFEGIGKEEWLAKVTADLKGRPLEELDWEFEGIQASPFYHVEDLQNEYSSINSSSNDNSWQIGEFIRSANCSDTNKHIHDALNQGVSALKLDIQNWEEREFSKMLSGVQHEWISTHLILSNNVTAQQNIRLFNNLLEEKGQDAGVVAGSVLLPKLDSTSWMALDEMFVRLPQFRIVLNTEVGKTQSSVTDLVNLLKYTYEFLQGGQERGISLVHLFAKLQYAITLGDDFYKSIIILRSVRRLIEHLCNTYGVTETPSIKIESWINKSEQSQDENYNLIKNTNQILGAVLGGADIVYPSSMSSESDNTKHDHRVSRNINHILRLECYLDRVVDPASGSYFFESMTDQLCRNTWRKFQERVESL